MFIRRKRENRKKDPLKQTLIKSLLVAALIPLCCMGTSCGKSSTAGNPTSGLLGYAGDGGYLYIINATPYTFYQYHVHSWQMNSWDNSFPHAIPPGTTRVYIEYEVRECACDDAGDAEYTTLFSNQTNYKFDIYGHTTSSSCGNLNPGKDLVFKQLSPSAVDYDIGWRWNGWRINGGAALMIEGNDANQFHILTYSEGEADWMGGIEDSRSLSTLTIPGTHDSSTYAYNSPMNPAALMVWTQDEDFTGQLNGGIRFFDMRCQSVNNKCELHHSTYDLGISLDDALNQIIPFLQSNPTETVLMSIKEEEPPVGSSAPLDQVINNYVQQNPGLWYVNNSIPTLGQVRGKIVLLRRYDAPTYPMGIDMTNWPDNQTFFTTNTSNVTYSVQDEYATAGGDYGTPPNVKWSAIVNEFNAAKVNSPQTLYINFTSSYWTPMALDPEGYAIGEITAPIGINSELFAGLQYGMGDANVPFRTRLGIVPLNYFEYMSWNSTQPNNAIPLLLIAYNTFNSLQSNWGQSLIPGQYILSDNGNYELIYQGDGNLVEYANPGQSNQTPIWAIGCYVGNSSCSPPSGKAGYAIMQTDGNFVVYDSNGNPYWASQTFGHPGDVLILNDDSGMFIQDSNGNFMKWL